MCSEENRLAAKLVGTTVTVNNFKPVLNFPWSYILLVQISHWRALLWFSNHFANHCVHHNCAGPTHFVSYLRTPVVLFQHLSQPLSLQHEVSRSPLSAHRCGSVSFHPIPQRKNVMFPPHQIWRQCCEEAKAVLREHIGDDVDPADGLHLLPLLHHLDHLHRQEEEGHRDGFGRGFAWTGTFAKTGRCTCHWRLKGRKVPALLDHHHLHLHFHLLHHHLHRQLSQVHSHRSQPLWLSQSWPDLICCLYLPWQPPLVICFLLLLVFKCFLRSLCLTDINHSSANYLFFEVSYRSSNYFIS